MLLLGGAVAYRFGQTNGIQVGGGWQLGDLACTCAMSNCKYKTDAATNGVIEYKRNCLLAWRQVQPAHRLCRR
jgi:hypothetical protein